MRPLAVHQQSSRAGPDSAKFAAIPEAYSSAELEKAAVAQYAGGLEVEGPKTVCAAVKGAAADAADALAGAGRGAAVAASAAGIAAAVRSGAAGAMAEATRATLAMNLHGIARQARPAAHPNSAAGRAGGGGSASTLSQPSSCKWC
jgi:hypothetical protein